MNNNDASSTSAPSYAANHTSSVLFPQEKTDVEPLSPKEIKAIGEIELGPSKHEIFLNKHYKKLLWGGIALGIIAGGVIAYFSHRNDVAQAAGAEVVQAVKLTGPASNATPADYDSSALNTLAESYATTHSADTGKLLSGLKELTGADPAKGVSALEALAAASQDTLVKARALSAVAYYYQSEGKTEEATAAWEKLVALGDTPYTAVGYLTLGDLARSAGDTDKARDYYKQAEDKCPTSTLVTAKTVQMHALMLDVDAPQHVAAPEKQEGSDSTDKALDPFGDSNTEAPAASGDTQEDPFGLRS